MFRIEYSEKRGAKRVWVSDDPARFATRKAAEQAAEARGMVAAPTLSDSHPSYIVIDSRDDDFPL